MPAVGDVYQVVHKTEYLGDQHINVYWYKVATLDVNVPLATELWGAFFNGVIADFWPIMSTGVLHRGRQVVNWNEPEDYDDVPYTANDITGGVGGDGMPDIIRWHYRGVKDRPGRTPGAKYLVGVSEAAITGNDAIAAYETLLQDFGQVLDDTLTTDNATFTPVVPIRYVNKVNVMPILGAGNPQTWQPLDWVYQGVVGRHFKSQG